MVNKRIFRKLIEENLFKNILILFLALGSLNFLSKSLRSLNDSSINDFLLVVSILLVTVCFANFAFSYEYAYLNRFSIRLLSHFATFIFMLLIALLLEVLTISVGLVYPSLVVLIAIFSFLLYWGVVLYDFWDFLRIFKAV